MSTPRHVNPYVSQTIVIRNQRSLLREPVHLLGAARTLPQERKEKGKEKTESLKSKPNRTEEERKEKSTRAFLHACRVSGSEEPKPPQPWFADRSASWRPAPSPSAANGSTSSSAASTSTSTRCLRPDPAVPPLHFRSIRIRAGFVRFGGRSDKLGFLAAWLLWMSQGADLMGKFGINVPRGAAVGSVQEVKEVLKNVFPSEKEVMLPRLLISYVSCR